MKAKKPVLLLGLAAVAGIALSSCSIFDIINISVDTETSKEEESRPSADVPSLDESDFDALIRIDTSAETSAIALSDAHPYVSTTDGFSVTSISTSSLHASGDGGFYFGTSNSGGSITFHFAERYITSVSLVLSSGSQRVARSVNVSTDIHGDENAAAPIAPSITNVTKFGGDNKNSTELTIFSSKSFYLYEIGLTFGEITPVYPTSVSMRSSMNVGMDKPVQLTYTYAPQTANTFELTWQSSAPGIASVSSTGLVTGLVEGQATITLTARTASSTTSCSCLVTVVESVAIEPTEMRYTYSDYQANSFYGNMDACPTVGNPKLLIIPVWFTDSNKYIATSARDNVRSDIALAYLGSAEETGWHSVSSFYAEESGDKVNLSGTVSDWYECGKASTYFYEESESEPGKVPTLVDDAAAWYFNNHPSESRRDYDSDGNGHLDGVMLIYGAPDYASHPVGDPEDPSNQNLWAYCFWTGENPNTSSPTANVFFWASYDFIYDSSKARNRTGNKSFYGGGNCSHCTVDAHTFIHEMGHVFGAEDYYDYSGQFCPAGGFSMQDMNVGGHDPYSVLAYGWSDPYIPTESCELTLHPFQSSKELILLTPQWNAYDSPFDEYLLLELYTPTGLNKFDSDYSYVSGYPKGPSATGIRLWHVDARLAKYLGGERFDFPVTDVSSGSIGHGMGNTYYYSDNDQSINYISVLGKEYADYNILQLIRDSSTATYRPGRTDFLTSSYLFTDGESFSMTKYKGQFKNSGKLNSKTNLGWSFSVSIDGSGESAVATVSLTRE